MSEKEDGFKVSVPVEIIKLLRELHGSDDDQRNVILSLSMVILISNNNDYGLEKSAKLAKMSVDEFVQYMDNRDFDWHWYYKRKFSKGDKSAST